MQEELLQFKLQKVWTLVDLPNGKRAIGTKWVYRNKKDERDIVIKNKARLMDVKSAFLYGKIEEEVYVCQLPGFEDPDYQDLRVLLFMYWECYKYDFEEGANLCSMQWIIHKVMIQKNAKADKMVDQEDDQCIRGKIANIDADEEEVEVEKVVSTAEVTTASATTTTVDELTLAQTLIEIKAAKPKAVTNDATTTTMLFQGTRLGGVKKWERMARQKEEDANIAEWDNVQAMIDADYELAARLQAQEQEELTIEERRCLWSSWIKERSILQDL
ncbi:ribonuclease H-like domain-containing protein [Tanacetum coccineum]